MPMEKDADFGNEKDGSMNRDYCTYCYKDGAFTADLTMEEAIEHNLNFLAEFNQSSGCSYTPEAARKEMQAFFPTLKRWKK